MIAETTRKMESLAASDITRLSINILLDIARAEAEAYSSGIFTNQYSEQLFDIRSFYERLTVLLAKTGEFADAEHKFSLLRRIYQLPFSVERPSAYEAKVISLHLLFLYTAQNKELFYLELASLEPRIASSAEVNAIMNFEKLIELGNYQRAFDIIQTLSPSHQALLGRLDKQRRYQSCKMIEYNHPHITVADLWKLLDVKDTDDFNTTKAFIEELYNVN